jgi:hypothetical protein
MVLFPSLLLAQGQRYETTYISGGDTVTIHGMVDSLVFRHPKVKSDTVQIVKTDTLYCNIEGTSCSKTKPAPGPTPVVLGKLFGPYNLTTGGYTSTSPNTEWANWGVLNVSPATLCSQIAFYKTAGRRLIISMTGGSHNNYITGTQFDPVKWKNKLATYNTTAIKSCVAAGVTDGTVKVALLVDEPDHSSWGGWFTKARVDSLAVWNKAVFPTLPTVAAISWDWRKAETYKRLDYMMTQFGYHNKGPIQAYRDSAVATAKRNGMGLLFSYNTLDGGTRPSPLSYTDTTLWKCPSGYRGLNMPNCWMDTLQVYQAGVYLGSAPYATSVINWRYDSLQLVKPGYKRAFQRVADSLKKVPAVPFKLR